MIPLVEHRDAEVDRWVDAAPTSIPDERAGDRYERHPGDVLRLIVWTVTTVVLVSLFETAARSTIALDADVAGWVRSIPPSGRQLARIVLTVAAIATVVTVVAVLVARRRWRRLTTLTASASVAAAAVLLLDRLTGLTSQAAVADEALLGWTTDLAAAGLAGAVAATAVARPWSRCSARRALRWLLVIACVAMVVSSLLSVVEVLLAVAVGNVVGAATLVIAGAPNQRPTKRDVATALRRTGIEVVELTTLRATTGRGELYRATAAGGASCFVKVYGQDRRDADRLDQIARSIRTRGRTEPTMSPRTRAEHEALVLCLARQAGLATAAVRALAPLDGGSIVLATTELVGQPLDQLGGDAVDAALLDEVWHVVARLHEAGLAHRALRASNVLVTPNGPAFVGLSGAVVGADHRMQLVDRAELLASLAALVGVPAAVASAARVLPDDDLAATMPYLQPLALSATSRRALPRADLERLRHAVAAATQHEIAPLVRLARVTPRSLFTLVALTGAFYLLLPQLANVDDSVAALGSADWGWLAFVVMLSALTYVFAAVGLAAAVTATFPFARVVQLQLASSFVNRVTPANVGGMALNVRFMQRAGVGAAEAVTGVALNVLAGALVHVGLLAVFVSWARQRPGSSFRLPGSSTMLVVVVIVLAIAGLAAATRRGRRLVGSRLLDLGRRSLASVATITGSPARIVALLGGSLGVTVAYGTAFGCAVQAFGGGVGLPEVGAVYLAAAAVAAVAPTPGGLGAMEAALVAGLIGAGMAPPLALAAVLTYRLGTFWLPILPGWLAFQGLQRHQHV